ncbi:MAG: DUF4097 family beta strand repeat-containing protein [Gaiellaceae bacterium]
MQKAFDVSGPVSLEVRLTSGEIEVEALAGTTRAEVELVAHDEDSEQLVSEARVELEGHRLIVDAPLRRGGGFNLAGLFSGRRGVTCRVRVPESSPLRVRTKSADVTAHGTLGGVDVATASGDVDVQAVGGGLSVKSASGDVSARSVDGTTSVQTASGDVSIGTARGAITVSTASGDVTVDAADGDVTVNTVSGDQQHGAVLRGSVATHSVSGDLQIGVRRGSKVYLDCNTVSGDTSSELELTPDAPGGDGPLVEIRAKTVSGDIRITRAPAPSTADPTNDSQEVHA